MATINKTFSVKNGLDVANTIIIDSSRNLSNIGTANVTSLNVSANIANVGNIAISQNLVAGNISVVQNTSTGNLSVTTLANVASLNVSGNIAVGNLALSQNITVGNLTVTQNTTSGNLSVTTLANIATLNAVTITSGGITSTQNVTTGNISVTQNASAGNLSVTQNASAGNVSVTTLLTAGSGQINGQLTVAGNLIVNGTTITLNASSVQTNDQYIILASNNFADTIDSGFAVAAKNTAQANVYSGLIRHAADETWHLFEGYALMNAYPATINTAQTNVATLNANVIAQQITLGGINVASWVGSSYAQANSGSNTVATFANGTLVLTQANLNFNNTATVNVSALANGTGQVNVAFSVNAAALPAGSSVNVYSNAGSVLAATPNLVFLNSQSILLTVTANGTNGVNVTPAVNATLNLTSLNVSANISNTGNILVSQNTITGNITVVANTSTGNLTITQNTSTGNLSITQNATVGNISAANVSVTGSINVGIFTVNTVQQTIATVSQTALDNFAVTAFGTAEYLVQANCKSSFYVTRVLVVNDGTNVYVDEYSTILTNGSVGSLTAAITAGNVQLLFTANNATSTVVNTTRYSLNI